MIVISRYQPDGGSWCWPRGQSGLRSVAASRVGCSSGLSRCDRQDQDDRPEKHDDAESEGTVAEIRYQTHETKQSAQAVSLPLNVPEIGVRGSCKGSLNLARCAGGLRVRTQSFSEKRSLCLILLLPEFVLLAIAFFREFQIRLCRGKESVVQIKISLKVRHDFVGRPLILKFNRRHEVDRSEAQEALQAEQVIARSVLQDLIEQPPRYLVWADAIRRGGSLKSSLPAIM
jgi:hypothetical protein